MATPQQIKAWRASLGSLLRDDKTLFSDSGKQTLAQLLKDGREIGAVDSEYEKSIQSFREQRLKYLRSQPLVNPQTGQPALKQNVQGQTVRQTGADLFVNGNFVPQAGSENIVAARRQYLGQQQQQVGADVARLQGVADVLQPKTAAGIARLTGAGIQGLIGGIGEGAKSTNFLGIGGLSKKFGQGPMTAQQLQEGLQQRSVEDITPEQALEDASKPARFGGYRFSQGVGGTLGGMVGSEIGGAAMTLSGVGKTAAAPFVMPLAAAASSFGGAAVANLLSEGAMKGTYGKDYKSVIAALQAAEQESPSAAFAADAANVLLQGKPVLSSGVGLKQTMGAIKQGVLKGVPTYVTGTAEQLGANAPRIANALEAGVALPQVAATASKYDTFVSNFLKKVGAASSEAADRYATFTPSGGLGSRIKQFGQFARDTPGVNELLADAIGEQAVNLGQASADYYREMREAQETGAPPPDPVKALANLALGSLFIGDNKLTGVVGGGARAVGSTALNVAGKIPGVSIGVNALKNRYNANLADMNILSRRADVLRGISSDAPTDTELEMGTRSRIGSAPGTRPTAAPASIVQPDETPISLGNGRVALWNGATASARVVPFGSVYGGIDDTANVADGQAIIGGISGLTTIPEARGINRLFPSGNEVLPTEGPSKQMVVGGTDSGHVVIREVPVSADGKRQNPVYDIVRVQDLEEKNKARGASILEKSGIEASTDLYQPTGMGAEGGNPFHQIQGFQEAIKGIDGHIASEINKQFPTEIQLSENVRVQARIVGKEKNGDVQVQLMTPGMTILRTDASNIIKNTTSVMEPMAISDILDEADLSDRSRPSPSKQQNAFDGSQDKFHGYGDGNVYLTPEQQAKLPEARAAINAARADASTRTSSATAINTAANNERDKQLKAIFNGRVKPANAFNDYEIGTPIYVDGPNGRERGLVIDNVDAGPVVHLDSMDGDPVIIQEASVIEGTKVARPEPAATTTSTSTTPTGPALVARTESDINSDNVFGDIGSFGSVRDKALFIARQLLKRKTREDSGETVGDALAEIFGFTKQADGKYVASDAKIQSRYNTMYNWMQKHYIRESATEAERNEILDAVNYLQDLHTAALANTNRVARATAAPRAPRAATTPARPATALPAAATTPAAAAATPLRITPRQQALNEAGDDSGKQIAVDLKFNNLRKLAGVIKHWFNNTITYNGESGKIIGQNGKGELLFLAEVEGHKLLRTIDLTKTNEEERIAIFGSLDSWETFTNERFIYRQEGSNVEYENQSPDFPKALRLGVVKVGRNKADTWVGARKIYQGNGMRVFQLSSGQLMYLPTGVDRTPVVDPIQTGRTRTGAETRPRGTTPSDELSRAASTPAPTPAAVETPAAISPLELTPAEQAVYDEVKQLLEPQPVEGRPPFVNYGAALLKASGKGSDDKGVWSDQSIAYKKAIAELFKEADAELIQPEVGDPVEDRSKFTMDVVNPAPDGSYPNTVGRVFMPGLVFPEYLAGEQTSSTFKPNIMWGAPESGRVPEPFTDSAVAETSTPTPTDTSLEESDIEDSPAADVDIALSSLQARALAGLVPLINGRPLIQRTSVMGGTAVNLAQNVVRKLITGNNLNNREKSIKEALDMPDYEGNEAWYRNAYQGIQFMNELPVRLAVKNAIEWMDSSPSNTEDKLLANLLDEDKTALRKAHFINDGVLDARALRIYGRSSRGVLIFGALAQSASNYAAPNIEDLAGQMIEGPEAIFSGKYLGKDGEIAISTVRATDRASFTKQLVRIAKKTIEGRTKSTEQLEAEAKAVSDMFDTFIHGATSRRIDLMLEAATNGWFTTRSSAIETREFTGTRGGIKTEFTSSVAEDLQPLYKRLREILQLSPNRNFKTYYENEVNHPALQLAYAQLAEEESKRFYAERIPAFANMSTLPAIADVNGALLTIYDPTQQTALSVIMAFKSADISTFVHEIAHAYLEALPLPLQHDISSAMGRRLRAPTITHPSVLSYEAQEMFATGLEAALSNQPEDRWVSSQGGGTRGATQKLKKVLKAAADAIALTYDILVEHGHVRVNESGLKERNWEVPYTHDPGSNPNGRVYLWKNAPVIFHDLTYGRVLQNFGTTKNGDREVKVEYDGQDVAVANNQIRSIGGPSTGLTPSVMQILSTWIGYRRSGASGKVNSTPESRAESLMWDGTRVVSINREGGLAQGRITTENVNKLLSRAMLTDVSQLQHRFLIETIGPEKLRALMNKRISEWRNFANNPAGISAEDNDLRQLTAVYAEARIRARLVDVVNRGNAVQKTAAQRALDGAGNSSRTGDKWAQYWAAVRGLERVIHANRYIMGQVGDDLRKIAGSTRNNWSIKQENGRFAYNSQTGDITILKTERRGRNITNAEYQVNLKTGAVKRPANVQPVVVEDTVYYDDPQFRTRMKGGQIDAINSEVKKDLEKVGLTNAFTMQVVQPEYHIARALLIAQPSLIPDGVLPESATVAFQTSGVQINDADDVTIMGQLSRNQQKAFVAPSIAVAEVPESNALVTMQEAEAIGRADQAMQQSSGVKVIAQSPEVKQRQAKFVQGIINRLSTDISTKLDAARAAYEKKNQGQTPTLYAYEAYELRDVYDVERGEPMVEMEATEGGEMVTKLRWDAKSMDYVPVIKTARVRTTIYSYEDLSQLSVPIKKSSNLYETDRHSSSTESSDKSFRRLEFGTDRPIWINTKGKEVPSKNKAKVVQTMVGSIEGRVRDVTTRWTSEYNDALHGESINPTEAWKPQEFDAEVKMRESDGITILAPSVKVKGQGYAIDTVDGNKGWSSLTTKEVKQRLTIAQAKNELMQMRKNDGQEVKHHAVAYPIETDKSGKPSRWGYSIMVRTTDVDKQTGTFQWKIENDWGTMNRGYDSAKDALKEAQIEHDKLFGLAREKQEEEVSRHIAREVIDIIDAGRRALDKWNADNNYKFTAEEANAVNILRQFRWYKGMEDRLKGTYGQFTTVMADVLGATSPQTPVWQNYAATLFLLQGDKGAHSRRVKLSTQTIQRNPELLNYFPDETQQKKAMVVIKADMRRTISVLKMHSIFVKALDKNFGVNPELTVGKLREQIQNRLQEVYERTGMDDTSSAEADLFVSLFEKDVPETKRQEVLDQFNRYADKSKPSRMGGIVKKDTQFRSFVNEVEDWISPKGEIARFGGKTAATTKIADLPRGLKLSLSETVVPRNLVTGALYGSNSGNILMALTNEWLTVTEGMSAKARNFAMNFVGLSRGATIDVWAARLTRRHLNEVYMGVYTTRDGESIIEDPARYEAWEKLPEAERKQFFRLSPQQEQGVAGGYVKNLPKKVASNGYFTSQDKETEPVDFAPATREAVDVTNAELIGEFGMANRVFARTADYINGYIGQQDFMSPADLQAVVWFAEKERWVQNGWTTAAGAGGSFEQMYHEMMERAGAYERVSGTVYQPRMRLRGASAASLSVEEQKSLFDVAMWPFLRHRRDSYQEGMGDLQREELIDGTNRHPVQSVQALAVTVSNDGIYTESAENANKTNVSVTYLTGAGREAEERMYSEPVATIVIPESDADIMFKGMTNATRTVYLPVSNDQTVLAGLHNYSVGSRTAFGIAGTKGPRILGTAVVDSVAVMDNADVPDDVPAKVKHTSEKYIRIQLAETQPMVDSDVYLWNNSGRADKMDARTNEYPWGQPLLNVDSTNSLNSAVDRGVSENGIYVGQIPLNAIKNANGRKAKTNILPKPSGIPAAKPANRVMVIESTASLLAAMRDSQDVFMTTTRAIANEDDVYAKNSPNPVNAVGKVPSGEAWRHSVPESNNRFGAYMLLRMPVGSERLIPGSRQAADNAHRRLMTSLRDSLPDVGYMIRIDADVRDWVNDITGNVGMPYVEVVFAPEEYIRNYEPNIEVNGELPSNAAARSALFNAYVNGDVKAIRNAEAKLAEAYADWMARVQIDPELSAQVMMPGQTVYDLQVIPKEKVLNAPSIRQFAIGEADRQSRITTIADAIQQYSEAIGKTVDVETPDQFYVSTDQPRIAQPDSVIEDWGDFREYTIMAQRGRPRTAEVTVSSYAGETRQGFFNIYNAALNDINDGRYEEARTKFNIIAESANAELENAFSDLNVDMSADITASVLAGDAKPAVTATVSVTADRLGTVIGRAALIGQRLGQPNTFVTENAGRARYGLETEGSMIVPSLTIKLNEPLDSIGLRTLVDSAPHIFQGATQSSDKRTLTVFMVPDQNIGTAEAREWTAQAQDLLNTFVQTFTTPADSYTDDSLQRLSMEIAPGTGSPADILLGESYYGLSKERQAEINRELTQSAIRKVEEIMGVRFKSIVYGLGGWSHETNASTVLQANITQKQAEIAAHMLGYALQQTAVWANKVTTFNPNSSVFAVDFIETGSKHLANSDKLSEIFMRFVKADDTSENFDNKLFQGFQPIRTADGRTGIRVIIKSTGEGTGTQIERLINGPIRDVVKSLDMNLSVDGYSCVLVEAENDWEEQSNGESYLERLGDLFGPSAKSTIAKLDIARQKLEQELAAAISAEPQQQQKITAGRRRLWNLGSSTNGGKGKFIEYAAVRDIVSNVAPDDSLPSPKTVRNTTNQAQRREIEEALSAISGQRVNLPKRMKFVRTPEHSIFQMHVGAHYDMMPKNALRQDPHVKKAYDALVKELDVQFRSLNLQVDFMQPVLDKDGKQVKDASGDPTYIDPYTNAEGKLDSTLAIRDVRENRHIWVYPTTEGTVGDAGDKADFEYLAKNHPLFQQSGFKTSTGQPMMWNDVLRAVHDALAHGTYGSSFSADGEENAFVAHAVLTQDPWAVWALASETRMQNSWVHYGPHRVLADGKFVDTKPDGFATQKVGLASLECIYTGCSTVDDRLRVFSHKLKTDFNGYNGTLSYLQQNRNSVPDVGDKTGAVEASMKRKLYIMRGLPGSGKSTKANELAGKRGQIFSTDDYFMDNGEYRFDAARLPEYHKRNLDAASIAMRRGTGTVVIDNTNIEPWHFEKYVEAGRLYGYDINFVEFDPTNYSDEKIKELASRNTHQVPESAIRMMRDKWVKLDAKKYTTDKLTLMTGTDLPSAVSLGPTLLHDATAKDATIDMKNGTITGNITPDVVYDAGPDATFIPNPNAPQADINSDIFKDPDDPTLMAQTGRLGRAAGRAVTAAVSAMRPAPAVSPVSSVRTQPIQNPAARAVFVLNQILKAGAAGDASPVLMQNFPLALDKPDLFLRQLRLQAQVIFNPNLGWTGRDGKTKGSNVMFGRKLAQNVWDTEVRNRASYEQAKKAGLSVSAISNEKDLEDAKQRDPLVQLMDISELGHNSDVATEADFLQHLPGQGQSERFFMLSKDVVKMRQFDDMVQHLIDIGYNPTAWELDEDGKLIETHWTRALKDLSHVLNIISGDVRIIEEDATDEAVMRIAKLLLFSPRWTASRLMLSYGGRALMMWGSAGIPGGKEKVEQILRLNGMSAYQLDNRDKRIGALQARLLWKSWSLWIALLAGVYGMRATNPKTMGVSIDKFGTRIKVGDYSFRMPGAMLTQLEMLVAVGDGWGEWQAQKGTVADRPLASMVWDKVQQTLISRASPIVSAAAEVATQRDALGQPAFVTDEAIQVFHNEVMEPMGLKGVPSDWNKALTKRVMWWWVRDCMEMYQQQREFGVESSEALINAVATGAYSAEGGRVAYFPKAMTQQIKAGQKMETQFGPATDFLTGGKAVIPTPDFLNPDVGAQPQEIRQPMFGGTGTDIMDPNILRRTEPPRQ